VSQRLCCWTTTRFVIGIGPTEQGGVFIDAVHPTHQVRPAGCWARKDIALAVEQTIGRDRLNIHGAINLETGQTQILAVERVNALSFIKLLGEIEGAHTAMRLIHVFARPRTTVRARVMMRVFGQSRTRG